MSWAEGADLRKVVDECLEHTEKLSKWETGFLESIGSWMDAYPGQPLSPNRSMKLEEIYVRVT